MYHLQLTIYGNLQGGCLQCNRGPGKDWRCCFSCPYPDCIWDGLTSHERQLSAYLDDCSARENGSQTERQLKQRQRYQENKEAAKQYYQQHKERYKTYYQQNRDKLRKRALDRYYRKVRPSDV